MSKQILPYTGYQVNSDGSLNPAEILVTNYLIRNYPETTRVILEKYGLQEIRDYQSYTNLGGDYDALVIKVRPDRYDLLREMLLEMAKVSRELQATDARTADVLDAIRSDAQEKLEKVMGEISKDMGEDT